MVLLNFCHDWHFMKKYYTSKVYEIMCSNAGNVVINDKLVEFRLSHVGFQNINSWLSFAAQLCVFP